MQYIKTFESYLDSGRAPLYHFISSYNISKILKDDKINTGMSIEDNFRDDEDSKHKKKYAEIFNIKDKIKSISFTRLSSLSSFGSVRLRFNVDKLKQKYKIFKIDEVGARGVKAKISTDNILKYKKYKVLDIHHNLPDLDSEIRSAWEVEFEERIYRAVTNVGKYITHIDMTFSDFERNKEELTEYIKKYPHIIVRELEYTERYVGKTKKSVPKEDNNNAKTLLDINVIKELEKEKELVN